MLSDDRPRLLSQPDFRKFWLGESMSWIGSQITSIALPLAAILAVGASTWEVGMLVAAGMVGTIVVTPFAGSSLDRRPVLPVIMMTNVVRALVLASVPLAYVLASIGMPLLYVVAVMVGALTAVFDIAVLAYVPRLASDRDLVDANGKIGVSISMAEAAGPALGGVLVHRFTAPVAILFDVISYLVSAAFLATIGTRERIAAPAARKRPALLDAWRGLTFCFAHRRLRTLLLVSAWFNAFEQLIMTVLLVHATRSLSLSPTAVGVLFAAAGAGGVVGSALAGPVGRRLGQAKTFALSLGVAAGALTVTPIPTGPAAAIVLCTALFVYGAGLGQFNVHAVAYRQRVTPDDHQGRVNAGYRLVVFGAIPVGAALAGVADAALGSRAAIAGASVALVLGTVAFVAQASMYRDPLLIKSREHR
jgi:MFS family permease